MPRRKWRMQICNLVLSRITLAHAACSLRTSRGARQPCAELSAHPVILGPRPSSHQAMWCCRCTSRGPQGVISLMCCGVRAECAQSHSWRGWPNQSSQSCCRTECRSTPFFLMSPHSEYIWAIFRHHRRRCEARMQEAASWLVAGQ